MRGVVRKREEHRHGNAGDADSRHLDDPPGCENRRCRPDGQQRVIRDREGEAEPGRPARGRWRGDRAYVERFHADSGAVHRRTRSEVGDVAVVVAELVEVFEVGGGNRFREPPHLFFVAVHQLPIHERFHPRGVTGFGGEVRDQQPSARREHPKHRVDQRARQWLLEIVEEPGGIDEVEIAKPCRAAKDVSHGSWHGAHTEAPVLAVDHAQALAILIERGNGDPTVARRAAPFDFAEMAAGDREHVRAGPRGSDIVQLARQDCASQADAVTAGRVELVAVEHAAERRDLGARRCRAVHEIHQHRVAGVAARFQERAVGDRRLEQQVVKGMAPGRSAKSGPIVRAKLSAHAAKTRTERVHAGVHVVVQERVAGLVENCGGRAGLGDQGSHGAISSPHRRTLSKSSTTRFYRCRRPIIIGAARSR